MSAPPQPETPGAARPPVLLVEDHPVLRRVLRRELEAAGWDVAEASDGETALAYLRDSARSLIVVLDYHLRGPTGAQVLEAVAAEGTAWGHAYIMMSADPADEVLHTAERYRVPLLLKPFETSELLRAVADAARMIADRGRPKDPHPRVARRRRRGDASADAIEGDSKT
jgi:two-component system, OmpR family, phosphate regulon response regulator PhoB